MSLPARLTSRDIRVRRARHTVSELIEDIGEPTLLTDEEVAALSRVIRDEGAPEEDRVAARRELVGRNIRLVIRMAHYCCLPGEDIGDLISDGTIGLNRAAEKFEPGRGYRFSTYAGWWIRQAIGKARMDHANGRPWRIPIHVHEARGRIRRYIKDRMSAGEPIGFDEAAERLGYGGEASLIARADAIALQERVVEEGPFSDDFRGEMGSAAFAIDVGAEGDGCPVERAEARDLVARFLRRLSDRERTVLCLYYGFEEIPGEDLRNRHAGSALMPGNAIAKHLGISRERVRQIRLSALDKVRRMAEEAGCF